MEENDVFEQQMRLATNHLDLTDNYLLAYEEVLKNNFGITNDNFKKLKSNINEFMEEFVSRLVTILPVDYTEVTLAKERSRFEKRLTNMYTKNLAEFIKNSNYKNNYDLLYKPENLTDLINLFGEYAHLLVRNYKHDKMLIETEIRNKIEYNYDDEELITEADNVFNFLTSCQNDNTGFKDKSEQIYETVLNALGLENFEQISSLILDFSNEINSSDLELNIELNGGAYYDKKNDITFIKYHDRLYKGFGKFDSPEAFLDSNKDLKQAIEDFELATACIGMNPTGFNSYKAKNDYYYYRINDVFYKSKEQFDNNMDIRQFYRIQDRIQIIKPVSELNFKASKVANRSTYNSENLYEYRTLASDNVNTILNAYKKYGDNNQINKLYTFRTLKASLKAYEDTTKESLNHLGFFVIFKPIISYFRNRAIRNLENEVKSTLHLTDEEFSNYYNNPITIEDEVYSNKDIVNKTSELENKILLNTEDNVELVNYLDVETKTKTNLNYVDELKIKRDLSRNVIINVDDELDNDLVFDEADIIEQSDEVPFKSDIKAIKSDTVRESIKNDPMYLPIDGLNEELAQNFDEALGLYDTTQFSRYYAMYIYKDLEKQGKKLGEGACFNMAQYVENVVKHKHNEVYRLSVDERIYADTLADNIKESLNKNQNRIIVHELKNDSKLNESNDDINILKDLDKSKSK